MSTVTLSKVMSAFTKLTKHARKKQNRPQSVRMHWIGDSCRLTLSNMLGEIYAEIPLEDETYVHDDIEAILAFEDVKALLKKKKTVPVPTWSLLEGSVSFGNISIDLLPLSEFVEHRFPGTAVADENNDAVSWNHMSADLPEAIHNAMPFISKDDTRTALGCVFIGIEGSVVATDGHRLCVSSIGDSNLLEALQVPRDPLDAIRGFRLDKLVSPEGSWPCKINISNGKYALSFLGQNWSAEVPCYVDGTDLGEFPKWEQVVPSRGTTKAETFFSVQDVVSLTKDLKQFQKVRREEDPHCSADLASLVKLKIHGNGEPVNWEHRYGGTVLTGDFGRIQTQKDEKFLLVGMNYAYLLDAAKYIQSDPVVMLTKDSLSPVLFCSEGGASAERLCVVMPMRID